MSHTAKRWSSEEIDKAVELFKKGKDYTYISSKLEDRSAFAVQCKMEYYVYEKINSGLPYKTLCSELKRTEEELKKMVESQLKRNPVKKNSTKVTQSETINFQPSPNNMYGIINRIMTPYIEYYENMERLEKLSENDRINPKTYKQILKILRSNKIDDEQFIEQLTKTCETKRINPVKSDSHTDESDNESVCDSDKSKKKIVEKEVDTFVIPKKRMI